MYVHCLKEYSRYMTSNLFLKCKNVYEYAYMNMFVTVSKLWKYTHRHVGCAAYLACILPFLLLLLLVLYKHAVLLCNQSGIELCWCSECRSYHLQHENPAFLSPLIFLCHPV